jgi:hypothetical protein
MRPRFCDLSWLCRHILCRRLYGEQDNGRAILRCLFPSPSHCSRSQRHKRRLWDDNVAGLVKMSSASMTMMKSMYIEFQSLYGMSRTLLPTLYPK